MTPRLTWSYKTYEHRFRDLFFPLNPTQRDRKIIELYALVSASSPTTSAVAPPPSLARSTSPIRPIQPQTRLEHPQLSTNFDQGFFQTNERYSLSPRSSTHTPDRNSISTIGTFSTNTTSVSSSAASIFSMPSDVFSLRGSIATTNSSVSQFSVPPNPELMSLRQPLKPPRHDPERGLWNGILRVIPCGRDHSNLDPQDLFERCLICGFSQWHALMVHARSMKIDTFVAAMSGLGGIEKDDFAGNSPIHFLMIAGVEIDYFRQLSQRHNSVNQNVFGQNPLHVLNPQDLGEDLTGLLEWFKHHKSPPGLLLTQRDIHGRTPLHALLQHPLPRMQYREILRVFPFAIHQIQSFDTAGRSIIQIMNDASLKLRSESESGSQQIQDGITDTRQLLSESGDSNYRKYGFNDIARGGRGTNWANFFECRICNLTNSHSNSYLDQMKCACAYGRDRNAPDETGLTPAHAIVLKERSNTRRQHEIPAETTGLFRILIPPDNPALREALHVLDPEGNTLVHNIAVRGFDELLEYVLSLETPARRVAMVNACSRRADGNERSVLECVCEELREINERIGINQYTKDKRIRDIFVDRGKRLKRCKHILMQASTEKNPSVTKRWRIC